MKPGNITEERYYEIKEKVDAGVPVKHACVSESERVAFYKYKKYIEDIRKVKEKRRKKKHGLKYEEKDDISTPKNISTEEMLQQIKEESFIDAINGDNYSRKFILELYKTETSSMMRTCSPSDYRDVILELFGGNKDNSEERKLEYQLQVEKSLEEDKEDD